MRSYLKLALFGFAVIASFTPAYAIDSMDAATQQVDNRTPLVVIRFNVSSVAYEDQLYGAVSEAIKAKSDVMFDVVGYGNKAAEVVATMGKIGVPASRISVHNMPAVAKYDEVQIFVR